MTLSKGQQGLKRTRVKPEGARVTQSAQAIEWGICLIRWAALAVVVAICLFSPHEYSGAPSAQDVLPLVLPILGLIGAYNLLVTLLLTFNIFFRLLPPLTLLLDTLGFGLLIFVSGGTSSPFFFLPVLPILVAAVRFSRLAGFLMALVYTLLLVGHGFIFGYTLPADVKASFLYQAAVDAILFFTVAAVGAVLADATRGSASADELSEAEASEVEQLKMVFEMAASLSATLNYQRLLDAILDISRLGFADLGVRVGESAAMVLLYDRDGFLAPATYRNLTTGRGDETRRIPGAQGIVAEAILSDIA